MLRYVRLKFKIMNWIEYNKLLFPIENISYIELTENLNCVIHMKDSNVLHITEDEYDFIRNKIRELSNSFSVHKT